MLADETRAAVWSITSGKGGVGKTTLSVNLGIALAKQGLQVLLMDADLGLANVDILLGVSPDRTVQDLLSGEASALDVVVEGPEGLSILPAASGMAEHDAWQVEDRHRLAEELGRLERGYDLILIDTGAGISSKVTDFVLASDRMLVVAVPEPTSIADAYAMVKVCQQNASAPKMGLIVNRARSPREAFALHQKFDQIVERFLGLHIDRSGYVLEDISVEQASRSQNPVFLSHPNSAASLCIEQLAKELSNELEMVKPKGPGLFDKLMDRITAGV
ncbi:MAG: flagellar biosynthesis protein FlhG [Candidatus Latescibacterota bacterium]|jgi:flagellar biosynthesis protein FlhG